MAPYLVCVACDRPQLSRMVCVRVPRDCLLGELQTRILEAVRLDLGDKGLQHRAEIRNVTNCPENDYYRRMSTAQLRQMRLSYLPVTGNQLYCELVVHSDTSTMANKENIGSNPTMETPTESKEAVTAHPKREKIAYSPITSYTFYESGPKFVMVVLKVAGIEAYPKENCEVDLRRRSIDVRIRGDGGRLEKNWRFRVAKTHDKYVPSESKHWTKKGKLVLKLKKKHEEKSVFSLYKQKMVGDKAYSEDSEEN